MSRRVALLMLLAAAATLAPRVASACAACGCGDPTLTVMGAELPFSGRKRVATEVSTQSISMGRDGIDAERVTDIRVDTSLSWAPRRWLTISATLPVIHRQVDYVNLGHDTIVGAGDLDLRAKVVVWRDRRFAPRTLLSVIGGAQLPTGPLEKNMTGMPLMYDVQTSTGAVTPLAGVAAAHFFDRWSLYASAIGGLPFEGDAQTRLGPVLRSTIAAQYQPGVKWGLLVAVDTRLEGTTETKGKPLADTGGFVAFVSPAIVWSPMIDLLLEAQVRVPAVERLTGFQDNGVIVALSAAYDF
jgi:hypothetical protein